MPDLTGQELGRYHLLEKLGEGGMATVYKAYDTRLEREVAVKIIRKEAFGVEVANRLTLRFEREAKALSKLTHANIVPIIDYGNEEGSPYLVMPLISGGTLKDWMNGKVVDSHKAAHIIEPIARALDYAHSKGILHRDVKPSNILLTVSGDPMLSDFGIAKIIEEHEEGTLTGTGVGLGTPEYMAPEQWIGKASPASDQYSLGVVLYEMVTGQKPYSAETPAAVLLKQATEPLPRPQLVKPGLPKKFERILLRALAKESENRYPTMDNMAEALSTFEKGGDEPESDVFYPPIVNLSTNKSVEENIVQELTTDRFSQTQETKKSTSNDLIRRDRKTKTRFTRGKTAIIAIASSFIVILIAYLFLSNQALFSAINPSINTSTEFEPGTPVQNTPNPTLPLVLVSPTGLIKTSTPIVAQNTLLPNKNPTIQSLYEGEKELFDPEGLLAFAQDFEMNKSNGFYPYLCDWAVVADETGNKVYRGDTWACNGWGYVGFGPKVSNGIIEFTYKIIKNNPVNDSSGEINLDFRKLQSWDETYVLHYSQQNSKVEFVFNDPIHNNWQTLTSTHFYSGETWHKVRLVLLGSMFDVYIDGNAVLSGSDSLRDSGWSGFSISPETTVYFDDIKVWIIP